MKMILVLILLLVIGLFLVVNRSLSLSLSPQLSISSQVRTNSNYRSDGEGFIDIVLISDSYKYMSAFRNDAQKYEEYFLKQSPYTEYKDKIHFYLVENTNDLQCFIGPTKYDPRKILHCDADRVYAAVKARGVPYDSIAVIINNKPSGTTAIGNIAFIPNGINTEQLFVHEVSHTFGLLDEYVVRPELGIVSDTCTANCCASPKCVDFQKIRGASCIQGCTYSNWYRSTENSIMGDLYGFDQFNEVSKRLLRQKLDQCTKADLAVLDNGWSWFSDRISLSAVIWNIGGLRSDPTKLRVIIDDTIIAKFPIQSLRAGEKIVHRWDNVWIAKAGTHTVSYCVTGNDSYEKNNCAKNVIKIPP